MPRRLAKFGLRRQRAHGSPHKSIHTHSYCNTEQKTGQFTRRIRLRPNRANHLHPRRPGASTGDYLDACLAAPHSVKPSQRTTHYSAFAGLGATTAHTQGIRIQQCARCLGLIAPFAHHGMRARIWDRARLSHVTVGCFPPGPGACAGCCSGGFDCGQTCHISWGARTCNSSIDPLRHTHAVYLTIMCTRARSRRPRRPRTCHAGAGSIQEPGGRHRPPPMHTSCYSQPQSAHLPPQLQYIVIISIYYLVCASAPGVAL